MMMRAFCFLAVSCLLVGCGKGRDYDGPKRIPLTGKVTLDGEAVTAGTISFIPQSEEQRVTGGVITDGVYNIPEAQGANAGTYRVEIRWNRPTGKQILDKEDTGEMIDVMAEAIPARYNANSELTVEISDSKSTFDFDLKSK